MNVQIRSFLGGMFIALGYALAITTGNLYLFAIGILGVYYSGALLVTTYWPLTTYRNNFKYNKIELLWVILFNLLGSFFVGLLFYNNLFIDFIIAAKLSKNIIQLLTQGIVTGILIGMAGVLSTKVKYPFIPLYTFVTFFVLLGAEHVVANAFLVPFAIMSAPQLLIVPLVGNLIGGWLIGFIYRKMEYNPYLTK